MMSISWIRLHLRNVMNKTIQSPRGNNRCQNIQEPMVLVIVCKAHLHKPPFGSNNT